MMLTQQIPTLSIPMIRGAAYVLRVPCYDLREWPEGQPVEDAPPLPLAGLTLRCSLAPHPRQAAYVVLGATSIRVEDVNVAVIEFHAETTRIPRGGRRAYIELYTVDDDASLLDDAVLARCWVRVQDAQIARHEP
jgi:hypothetical protein